MSFYICEKAQISECRLWIWILKVFYSVLKTKSCGWKPLIVPITNTKLFLTEKKKWGMEKIVLGVGQFFFSVSSKQICSLSIPWAQVDDKFINIIFFVAFPCFGFPFKDCCKIRFRSVIFNASHLTNMTTDDRKSTNAPKHQSNKSPPHQSTKGW